MPTAAIKEKKPAEAFVLQTAQSILDAVLLEVGDLSADSAEARTILLKISKAVLAEARRTAEIDLLANSRGTECAKKLCRAEDELIRAVHMFATQHVYRRDNPSGAEAIALAAVGGYGRATLAPGSDIDLLFILPYKQTPWGEQVTEFILYLLWDLGQKVGHAVRSVDECIRMSKSDMTVRTATLESRFLTGDHALYDSLEERFEHEFVEKSATEFIAAKMAERDERHTQMGNTRYVVEPNIKDGKGGLRDLNTLFWIGKYFFRVREARGLVAKGVLSRREYKTFEQAEDFLWAVRCHLHFVTGRADEKLSFDLQPELAERLGFVERRGMLSVERFMKRYFLVAKDVGDLTRIFCTSIEFDQTSQPDLLARVLEGWHNVNRKKIRNEKDFIIERGRLNLSAPDIFEKDSVNLIKIFWIAGREGLLFHPDALKAITRSLRLIKKDLRKCPRANKYFLDILTAPKSVERILRRMNESGVLGKFVPEFGKIVALMQFNMYHHYTVDEHLIRSIGVMAEIENGGLTKELPLTHTLLPKLADHRLLYVALFLHDIAKGRDEDHSIAGARIAKKFCVRLGLTPAETDTVSWLIEHHLLMSEVAQARDIQDPETARAFADVVQSPDRLTLLMILTACDIRAVGPGVWTGWKGSLLRALYYATEPLLSGHSQLTQSDRIEEAKETLATQLTDWSKKELVSYQERHYAPYWLRAEMELQTVHAKMIKKADATEAAFAGAVRVQTFEGITEISVYTPDHPRLLSLIAGACTMAEASIIGAQIFSTRDGYALDTLRLRRGFPSDEDEKLRGHRIIETVKSLLQGTKLIPVDLGKNSRLNRRLKPFSVPSQVLISNVLSQKFTVIEVSGLDRTGLLHHLTNAIADLNVTIASAHISTFGEKVVDVLYVTDLMGHKVVSKQRQNRIKARLLEVLDQNPNAMSGRTKSDKTTAAKKAK